MDPRARSSRVTRATTKPRRKQRSLTKIANADRKAGRTKAPLPSKAKLAPAAKSKSPLKAGSPLTPLAVPQKLAKAKDPDAGPLRTTDGRKIKAKHAGGGLPNVGGLARALAHGTAAVAEDIVEHPVDAAGKTAKTAAEIAKGTAATAIGIPVALAKDVANDASNVITGGHRKTDTAPSAVKRIVKETAKSYSDKYGPSYRGEKGAYKRLKKKVEEEGPLPTALDVATVVAPASSGIGKIAKLGERARPRLKTAPLKAGAPQHSRPSAIGAGVDTAHDAARKGVQRVAETRADTRLRTKLPLVKARHIEGRKPSILNTEPKPLTARRANLNPGEVAPVSEKAANRAVRRRVAERHRRGVDVAKYRVKRHVTGRKGEESLRKDFDKLPEDLHGPAITAAQLGITDAAGARSILPVRIREIEANRTKALAREGKHGTKDAKAEARARAVGDEGELPALRAMLADPSVFDHPGVQQAAAAVRRRPVGAREGLSAERAAASRSKLVGGTLGVKTAREMTDEARAAHEAKLGGATAAVAAKRGEVVRLQKDVSLGRARTREAAIGAKQGSRVRVGDTATLKAIGRNAAKQTARGAAAARRELKAATAEVAAANRALGDASRGARDLSASIGGRAGGLGVAKAEQRLAAAQQRLTSARAAAQPKRLGRVAITGEGLVRDATGLRVAKQELQAAKERATEIRRAPPERVRESSVEYERRVGQAAVERNLAPPEYVPSKFEQEGLPSDRQGQRGPANPLGKTRSGTLYRLGREDKTLAIVEQSRTASLKRGAAKEAEGHILGDHGIPFESDQAARDFAAGLGLNTDRNLGRVDVAIHSPLGGEAPKGMVTPRSTPKGKPVKDADAGDYVKTDNVFLVPKAVKEELDSLNLQTKTPPSALQKLAHYPQAALLALSPSWFQFQRVNDAIAATLGGSAHHTVRLEKVRQALDPDSREVLHMMAGGSISSELLTPFSAQKIGRMQRILDNNRFYQKAFGGANPATVLLRADQAITGTVRERQLLHNLSIVARKMDPDVAAVSRAFGPIGHAFKTADVELAQKLLKDPTYASQLEDAAQRLYKIHGDWHNYTGREQRLKHYAAFYGFLRYATRMALYTLPVKHPYVGMLVGQLGRMGAEDAKRIIGNDIPYGLSALYNDDGTVAVDFTRANPLLGPLFSVDRPEQAAQLATPLASLTMSYLLGQPIGLNDSSTGRIKQFTVEGDPTRHDVGGFFGEGRTRIAADQLLGLLSPYREWKKFDGRQQSSDSLAWDRRFMESTTAGPQVRIDERNAEARKTSGLKGLIHDTVPLVSPGSGRNMKKLGQTIAAAKEETDARRQLGAAKRQGSLHTPAGRADREIDLIDAQIKAAQDDADREIDRIDREIELELLRQGLK